MLATPLVLLAGGWAIFYLVKDPPRLDACSEGRVPGVEEYRDGLGAYATFAAVVIGSLIARISTTKRTMYPLAACAWLAAVYNLDNDAFHVHALGALIGMLFGGELLLACSAIATLAMRRPRVAQLTYLWTALLLLVPAAVTWPAGEGVAFLCLD